MKSWRRFVRHPAPTPSSQQPPIPCPQLRQIPQDTDRRHTEDDSLSSRGNTVNAAVVLGGTLGRPQSPRERRVAGGRPVAAMGRAASDSLCEQKTGGLLRRGRSRWGEVEGSSKAHRTLGPTHFCPRVSPTFL